MLEKYFPLEYLYFFYHYTCINEKCFNILIFMERSKVKLFISNKIFCYFYFANFPLQQ